MKQIILTLPDALISEIRWVSEKDGLPEAEIIREALEAYLAQRRIARLHVSDVVSNRSSNVSDEDQYFADLAEPYR